MLRFDFFLLFLIVIGKRYEEFAIIYVVFFVFKAAFLTIYHRRSDKLTFVGRSRVVLICAFYLGRHILARRVCILILNRLCCLNGLYLLNVLRSGGGVFFTHRLMLGLILLVLSVDLSLAFVKLLEYVF